MNDPASVALLRRRPEGVGEMAIYRLGAALVVLVLAGCGVASEAGLSAPRAPDRPGASTPATPATVSPGATPIATPSCPAGTLSVAQFLAAPPSCYLSSDVAVAGWSGQRRDDEPGSETAARWLLRGSMPFGLQAGSGEDLLFVDEASAVGPGGGPDGVHWATVTGRGSASADRGSCHRDPGMDVMAAPHCPRYLTASRVVESEPPAGALAGCSALSLDEDGSADVQAFTSYPAACFGSRDATVSGWLDVNYLITGWEDPWSITPAWLWVPIGPWTVVAPFSNPVTSSALPIYLDPARHVDARRTNRWVLLAGHYADPAAQTCRVEYASGVSPAPGSRVTDTYARRLCEAHFVVTSIRDAWS
jgi:hypothetical protein